MISVGIIGASGYTGKYLIKFLNDHTHVRELYLYANKSAGRNLLDIFPEFTNNVNDRVINSVNQIEKTHDVYFFALPHGKSIQYAPELLNRNKKVIDLGADFRLDDAKSFAETYQMEHTATEFLSSKIYGLPEFHTTYNGTDLIANPGCYPTAALLSTIPFAKHMSENIETISTVSYSGLSGAGKKADTSLLFSENYNSVRAYNVGTHRHQVEIAQELNKYIDNVNYSLATHLLPVVSGIYSTSIIHLNNSVKQIEVDDILDSEYSGSSFVRIRKTPPELKWVVGTNYCDINVKALDNKIIVTACIDNLIKGASGQAVQNMNKLYGWEENLGIQNNLAE